MKFIKLLMVMLLPIIGISQTLKVGDGMQVVHFNAGWNSANDVEWHGKLKDCEIKYIDIASNTAASTKFKITVVPTIIVFNGDEVKRFEADISFAITATKQEVQEIVDEIVMDQF